MATSSRTQAIGSLAVVALVIASTLRLVFDALALWNAQSVPVADRWVLTGPGDQTATFMVHWLTRSQAWLGCSSLLLLATLFHLRRSRRGDSSVMRLGMLALVVVAPSFLTDASILRGRDLPGSWFVLCGAATLAPLAIWLGGKPWQRRARERSTVAIARVISAVVVSAALLVGVAWLRAGVELRGTWATFSGPVPSPQLLAPATSERCTRERLEAIIDGWAQSGTVTRGIDWMVIAADGQIFSSPGELVPPFFGAADWRPEVTLSWWEVHELGPSTGLLLLVDERAPRGRVEQVERALAEAEARHVARVGVRWRSVRLVGLPVLEVGELCSEGVG